ncbi:MAG: ABC transporter permease [Cellulomonas sp.]|nr:ABC transporter permease [Cellulomonas sp.]
MRASRLAAPLGLTPFAASVLLFLALPTVLAIGTGLFDKHGAFTWGNLSALGDPVVLRTFRNSITLSAASAVVGAVVGALVCVAALGLREGGFARGLLESAASVIAQFGGVMLAFAFIATIGLRGMVTVWLRQSFGIDIFASGAWIYAMPGLYLPYIYFQVPMMVITFLPALTALRPQWAEATLTLGGTTRTFWARVAVPVLAPSFLASFLLLFANAFSSYATAAALASQGAQIVPLQIRAALTSETVLGRQNLAGALALGMVVVMALVMWAYSAVQRRAARWQR